MDQTAFHSYMQKHRFGVVSSVSKDGSPQSALVGIATSSSLQIIFDTVKSSRKYANLVARPHCSFVVGWAGEQTLQFEGVAEEPKGKDLERYLQTYFEVWPECEAHLLWPNIAYFVVRPQWIRLTDYDQRPSLIEEMTFDD